jgi:hypothetical protein
MKYLAAGSRGVKMRTRDCHVPKVGQLSPANQGATDWLGKRSVATHPFVPFRFASVSVPP